MKKITNNATNTPLFDDEAYKTLCTDLGRSRTLADLTESIGTVINRLGFSHFQFIRLERHWPSGSQRGWLSSFPSLYRQCYLESKLYEVDWLLAYGKTNAGPIFSSHIHDYIDAAPLDVPVLQGNRHVFQLYKRYKFYDVYAVPLPAHNGHGQVLLLLGCEGMDSETFHSLVSTVSSHCHLLCKAIDTISTQRFRTAFIQCDEQPTILTPSQLRVLRGMANEDHSITALAKQLCISPITAHQHIAATRKALGVHTNTRAVVKAIKAGLITLQ